MKNKFHKFIAPLLSMMLVLSVMVGGAVADTTLTSTNSEGVTAPASATATTLTGITLAITEALPASIVTSTTDATVLRLQLDNSAKFSSTVITDTNIVLGGDTFTAVGGGAAGTAATFMKADGTIIPFTFDDSLATPTLVAADFIAQLEAAAGDTTIGSSAVAVVTITPGKGALLTAATGAISQVVTAGYGIDTNGVLSIPTITQSGTAGVITLSNIAITTELSTIGDAINLTYLQAPTGYTSTNTMKLATVATSSVTAALLTAGSELSTDAGKVVTIPAVKLTESFAGDLPVSTTDANVVKLTVKDSAANILPLTTATVAFSGGFTNTTTSAGGDTFTAAGGGTAGTAATFMKADGSVISFTFDDSLATTTLVAADFIAQLEAAAGDTTIGSSAVAVVTIAAGKGALLTAATGTISVVTNAGYGIDSNGVLSVAVKAQSAGTPGVITITPAATSVSIPADAPLGDITAELTALINSASTTSSVKVGEIAESAATIALFDATPTTTTLPTLFTGRATNDPLAGTDAVRFSETVAAMVPASSFLTLTANTGKMGAVTDTPAASPGIDFTNNFTVNSAGNVATGIVATISSGAGPFTNDIDIANVDLTTVTTPGEFTITSGGSNTITETTIKLADILDATATSVEGEVAIMGAGNTIALPTIVITESVNGALTTTNGLGFYAAKLNGANLTATDAKVKAYKADGTDISTTILGNSAGKTPTVTTAGVVYFTLSSASTTSTGPVTLKITGLTATINANATGDITAVVGGMDASTQTAPTSDLGAKATKATITIGKIVSSTVPSISEAVVVDGVATSTLVPAGNNIGQVADIYVVAGSTFYDGSAWVDTETPYEAGVTLAQMDVSFDVSTLDVGTKIFIGYGVGLANTYNTMNSSGTLGLAYTVPEEAPAFAVTPTVVQVAPEGTKTVSVANGTAPYTIEIDEVTVATIDVTSLTEAGDFVITGVADGTATVTVTDSSDPAEVITVAVTVAVAVPLAIDTETLALAVAETGDVVITGGVAPYTVSVDDEAVATAVLADSTVTVTGVANGTAVVTITDSADTPETKTVAVNVFTVASVPADSQLVLFTTPEEIAAAPLSFGDVAIDETAKKMEVSVNFPAYEEAVDLWVAFMTPDQVPYVFVDGTLTQYVDGPVGAFRTATTEAVTATLFPEFDTCNIFGQPVVPEGTWTAVWIVAPTNGGVYEDLCPEGALEDCGSAFFQGVYTFDVSCDETPAAE